ncbi:hypothetical protein [Kitasatospora sp. NPDC094015]|uniref:hypothetical protein n=1 Tax=Kitasatospora sp. NPDC094015 TaxID=3155205 RepID=UPI00332CCB8D
MENLTQTRGTRESTMESSKAAQPLVEIAEFRTDSRYRLVHFQGIGWKPLAPEEFEPELKQHFPDLDPHDAQQVRWADRPWEWPAWRPGEA